MTNVRHQDILVHNSARRSLWNLVNYFFADCFRAYELWPFPNKAHSPWRNGREGRHLETESPGDRKLRLEHKNWEFRLLCISYRVHFMPLAKMFMSWARKAMLSLAMPVNMARLGLRDHQSVQSIAVCVLFFFILSFSFFCFSFFLFLFYCWKRIIQCRV